MAVFNEINAQGKAAGLPELTLSDDLYNSTTLLHYLSNNSEYHFHNGSEERFFKIS